MTGSHHYVIRGGVEGRERLRVLARVMRPSSMTLFDRLGLTDGMWCLDAGCGGGDVTLDLAARVAPGGRVVGVDIDEAKLDIARAEASQHGVQNVEFRCSDVRVEPAPETFDAVYARFLLTHLSDPGGAVRAFHDHLRPGGMLAVEDIDFNGCFTYPESRAFERYRELYCAAVTRRGGNPFVGPQLPALLMDAGFADVGVGVVQHVAMEGEAKLLDPLTMQNIAGAVIADGLASQDEIDAVVLELYEFAANSRTLAGTPRIVQAWGRRAVI